MADDLEDFLRRAAQRRKAKAAQGGQQGNVGRQGNRNVGGPPKRTRPEYSNRKTERLVRDNDEEVLSAELVDEDLTSRAAARKRQESTRRAAADSKRSVRAQAPRQDARESSATPDDATEELLDLLRRPGGIKQAILLKEILERPEHRW